MHTPKQTIDNTLQYRNKALTWQSVLLLMIVYKPLDVSMTVVAL